MAIYHLAATIIKRSEGRSATAAAAYRAGARIQDHRTGVVHDYSRRRGIDHREIMAPAMAPTWTLEREALWNAVEFGERRRDAQVAREINAALPRELDHTQKLTLIQRFVARAFVSEGMVADVALHDLDSPNPHAHVLLTMRGLAESGFGPKQRQWDAVERLREWRALWAAMANEALEQAGRSVRIDHRSLAEQGAALLPTVHLGPKWTALNRERPSTPLPHRDQRSQANAAIARLNGAREARWAVAPEKAARSAAAHYERLAALWHRAHDQRRLEARCLRPVPSVDVLMERSRSYVRRRTALAAAESATGSASTYAADVAQSAQWVRPGSGLQATSRDAQAAGTSLDASEAVAAMRGEMREWVDDLRERLGGVTERIRERQRHARDALAMLSQIESQAARWSAIVEQQGGYVPGRPRTVGDG